jgi:hypothetical protein
MSRTFPRAPAKAHMINNRLCRAIRLDAAQQRETLLEAELTVASTIGASIVEAVNLGTRCRLTKSGSLALGIFLIYRSRRRP